MSERARTAMAFIESVTKARVIKVRCEVTLPITSDAVHAHDISGAVHSIVADALLPIGSARVRTWIPEEDE